MNSFIYFLKTLFKKDQRHKIVIRQTNGAEVVVFGDTEHKAKTLAGMVSFKDYKEQMSYTIVYGIPKDGGGLVHLQDCTNSWRGAMWIWNKLSKKYLGEDFNLFGGGQRVWDLWKDPRLSDTDFYCLMTTFDGVLVDNEMMTIVADSLDKFEPETENLKLQAQTLRQAKKDGMMAVCWNQNSICGDVWYVREDEEERLFNINIDKDYKHTFLKPRGQNGEDS